MLIIKNVSIFNGEFLEYNKNVLVSQGKIIDIIENSSQYIHHVKQEIEGHNHILAPGFIDMQVNGGGGVFFNEQPHEDTLFKIQQIHLKYGTTSFLPTFISDTFQKTRKAIAAVEEALRKKIPGILGIHLEGPYLNELKSGIHSKKYIRSPLKQEIDELCQTQLPIKLITLAPEIVPKCFMEQLIENKFTIFAGHTNATYAEMSVAVKDGVCGVTHLFNACSPFLSREPGVVGFSLLNDDIWCGIIADGLHVHYSSIKLAFKSKSLKRFILISDAMAAVGTSLSEFKVQETEIKVTDKMYHDKNGVLSGSSLTILQALQNIVLNNCATIEHALAMSSTNAAKCLHLDHVKGKVSPQYDADLVLLNKHNLNLVHVFQAGEQIV